MRDVSELILQVMESTKRDYSKLFDFADDYDYFGDYTVSKEDDYDSLISITNNTLDKFDVDFPEADLINLIKKNFYAMIREAYEMHLDEVNENSENTIKIQRSNSNTHSNFKNVDNTIFNKPHQFTTTEIMVVRAVVSTVLFVGASVLVIGKIIKFFKKD